jgi:SAM-dependent methyltransferase
VSFLRAFHAANAGITSRAFARTDSYARLAAKARGRVLDLGCGNAPLGIGLDQSIEELALTDKPRVQGRAQELPFADRSFDTVVSHLAFMLFDEPERVVAEIDRVLVPGGAFHAVLGGGPTAHGNDLFHQFLAIANVQPRPLGDKRARSEAGWRALFQGWTIAFERFEVGVDATTFFASLYEDHDDVALVGECRVVLFLASATR